MSNNTQLAGKISLVTGAGSGIGLALAKELGKRGATVIGTDIKQDRLDSLLLELKKSGVKAFAYKVDHTNRAEVEALAQKVEKEVGLVDILCSNAGVGHGGKVDSITLEDWKWVIDINLWGTIYMIHYFLPPMVKRNQGHIMITSSGAGLCALGYMAAYSMTKAAMVSLVTVMRMDLAAYNINVSALCPGIIKTNVMKDGRLRGEHNTAGAIEFYETKGLDPAMVARLGVNGLMKGKAYIYAPWDQVAIPYLLYRLSPDLVMALGRMFAKKGANFLGPYFKE